MRGVRRRWQPLSLVLLALLAYPLTWSVGFLSDDFHLVERPAIWGFGATGFSRPLAAALFGLELALFGPSSVAFHGLSLALHAVNGLLLGAVLRELELPPAWQAM